MASQPSQNDELIGKIMSESFGFVEGEYTFTQNKTATNNQVYIILLSQPTASEKLVQATKALTEAIPAGTTRLVVRIARPDNNVEDSIRIRNEVACLTLARRALINVDPLLIPRVFDWNDDPLASYIVEEFKQGDTMSDADAKVLGEKDLKLVCSQIAAVAKAFQSYELPINGYGGLTFDDAGNMDTTKVIFRVGGPFSTYREYLKATLEWQLAQSDNVVALKGWRGTDGLRERIDNFVANGLDPILAKIPETKPTLIHGDMTLPNFLFDLETKRMTAVVDFDFGHVGGMITEFLYSFPEFQGLLTGVTEPEDGIRELMLNGFSGPVTDKQVCGKVWDAALAAQEAQRPSTIEGADETSSVWWFAQDLMHFHWLLPRFYESQTEEQIEKAVEKGRNSIDAYLSHWGY